MAGVVLADSFSAAESVAKSRVCDRQQSEASFSSRRGRRQISLVFNRSRAAFRVALDGNASPAAAGSRLLVFLLAPSIPSAVIDMKDYGSMDGKKVLRTAYKLMKAAKAQA